MALETQVLLKSLLFNVLRAQSYDEVVRFVKTLCDEEMIAYVEKMIGEEEKHQKD